jgi:exopolyphosphatase/pppGpp-phosphohydrolase
MFKKKLLLVLILIISINNLGFGQNTNLFAGIEIGSKGIKMSVIEINNIKKSDFKVISFWTVNVGISKGISIDGNLAKEDIDKALQVINSNYIKIRDEFKVDSENIFIVGSSGVAMAKNTYELIKVVKNAINKDLEFIDVQTEAKMLLKGCVPPNNYKESMVLDIGGGNTKGGYVDVKNDNDFVFFPLAMNYGSVTLTESILKKTNSESISEYNEKSFGFMPILREQINAMYGKSPIALEKERVYMSGGAVWAFYTLFNEGKTTETFNEFKLEDVISYDAIIKNNFIKYEKLAKTNKNIDAVLKTYSQKYLISGSNILQVCLEAVPGINDKKLFFAKEGQIAWLVSYVTDKSKKIKKIY